MDEITQRVAAQYNRYPYPMDPNQIRADAFVDWLLAQVEREGGQRPLRVLDAGCGTGNGIVPVAEMAPQAQCVGVDVSEQALRLARITAQKAGLTNLTFAAGDLMQSHTLPRVEGGYDIIYCSGVLHHLADPSQGLSNLLDLLAPDGVMVVMVYNSYGRAPVWRFARAMDLIWPDRRDLAKRVPLARSILAALPPCAVNAPPWDDAAAVPDNELVDRYLHAHDRGYTVLELFALLESAHAHFLRWLEPRAWEPINLVGRGQVAAVLDAMPHVQRYAALDLLFDHPSLTLLVGGPQARIRQPLNHADVLRSELAVNPQVRLATVSRRLNGQSLITDIEATVRGLAPQRLSAIQVALVQALEEPITGAQLVQRAREWMPNLVEAAARDAIVALLRAEIFFAPHRA
jgi:ubiquinone/menaquinone biosynthesis C-methylase UbiE